MDRTELDKALRCLCDRFRWHRPVEILIVGGAAGMLTNQLSRDRVTVDCDIINYVPDEAFASVESLADTIGKEMGLPDHWFNSQIAMRTDLIPDGWQQRKIWIDSGDFLHVYAISRVDLIAMKFYAGRPQDLEDLDTLGVTDDDRDFVAGYLAGLYAKGTPPETIAEATEILRTWSVRD